MLFRTCSIPCTLLCVLFLCAAASGETLIFVNATEGAGLAGLANGPAAWGDFNNNGWPDLYVNGVLWRNDGGQFTKVEGTPFPSGGGVWGDMNNNGLLDLYAYRAGELFENLGDGAFRKVEMPERPMKVCLGAAWVDLDNDGFLDLYVAGYEIWRTQEEFHDVVYRNVGGGEFVEVWRTSGRPRRTRGVATADFNENGLVDVHVSNYRLQQNYLWRNDGGFRLTDVAEESGTVIDQGKWKGHTIGSAWGDLDNDGHLDLFVGNFSHPPEFQDRPVFLRNLGPEGGFRFQDMSAKAGLHWQESYASPAFGDYDNDGWLDLFFTTVYRGDHSVLYRNQGGWRFSDVTEQAGVRTARTYQSAWADYNGNGQLDLVSGGALFRNTGSAGEGNDWLKVRLVGAGTVNRPAIGAQARIKSGGRTLTRQVESATGQGNQNDFVLHFGLGPARPEEETVQVEIRWPGGKRQIAEARRNALTVVRYEDEQ